ncbi:putative aspartate aminotransferase [Penicillium brasilianum]|uniref:Putative aspartate aminotransferase n=1 Tax=Penicillium brasilianum TaxID=104259 RepID=A0A1S9RA07_PENBI|nr:putative aspartate aminotransferase [Penicillium brasilianum]
MGELASFALPKWIDSNKDNSTLALAGSAAPSLSLQDLIDLSTDKETTSANLSIQSLKLSLGPFDGSKPLRQQIAALYDDSVTAEHIFPTHGTTGANALLLQSLLKPGDHVIAMYPCYTQLISLPKSVPGVEVSYWTLGLQDEAQANIQQLQELIRPNTKMIILNNPNNPLGSILPLTTAHEIVNLSRTHGLTVLVDEIFRPLFHAEVTPPSFISLSTPADKIIVTSSMSKAWGLSGTRIGWLATLNTSILTQCSDRGLYTTMALSSIDSVIATEALSDRCRPQILTRHLDIAQRNIALLDAFVESRKGLCEWVRPAAGGTAFIRFLDGERRPVDDVVFCRALQEKKGVLLAPGSLCFGTRGAEDFRGYVRVHITVDPGVMEKSLVAIGEFLDESPE